MSGEGLAETPPLSVPLPQGEGSFRAEFRPDYAFLTQAVHQPLAVTSLAWKIAHGPLASPSLPVYRPQLAQCAVASVRFSALVASAL